MRDIGTNALPVLLRMLDERDSSLKDMFYALARKQHFLKIQAPMRYPKADIAFWGLRALGSMASNAVPQLMQMYENDRRPNSFLRQTIPAIMSGIGPPAEPAIPLLIRLTASTNDNVRMNSVYALGSIHAEAELVVPALIKCLSDPFSKVRDDAAMSLGVLGASAKPAIPALRKLLRDEQAKSTGEKASSWPPNGFIGASPRFARGAGALIQTNLGDIPLRIAQQLAIDAFGHLRLVPGLMMGENPGFNTARRRLGNQLLPRGSQRPRQQSASATRRPF